MANTGGTGPVVANATLQLQAAIDQAALKIQAQRAAETFNQAFNQANKTKEMAKQFDQSMGKALTGAAIGVTALTAAVVKLGSSFGKIAGDFQSLEISLDAIIKNSKTARTTTEGFIGSLRQLALQSGRSSQELANTGRQFLALGFSGTKTTEVLTAFTKGAALVGATNEQLRLALNGVSQIAAKGAVSMEELRRQIAENLPGAVNLSRFFEILGENMGITTEEARKLQEQGKITADEGIKALVQQLNEATEGVDVFAIRAGTLAGVMGILREGFTQAVQTGFRPFIDTILGANGPLGNFLATLRGGGQGIAGLNGLIERFANTLGTSFVDILNEIIPLIPQIANLFVTLTEAFAPVIVDIVKIGASIASALLPALNLLAMGFRFLLTELGPVSFVLRQLVAGGLINGLVRAFGLFGRALGSIGGLIGRVATPVSTALRSFSEMSNIISGIVTAIGFLNPVLNVLDNVFNGLAGTVVAATGAFFLFNVQAKAAVVVSALKTSFDVASTGLVLLITRLRAATAAMTGLQLAAGTIVFAGVGFAIAGLITALQNAKANADALVSSLTASVDTSNLTQVTAVVERLDQKLQELKIKNDPKKDSFWRGLGRSIVSEIDRGLGTDFEKQIFNADETGVSKAMDGLRVQGVLLQSVFASVANKTGASFEKIRQVAAELKIDLSKIVPENELATIDALIKGLEGLGKVKLEFKGVDTLIDKFKDLFSAAQSVKSATDALTDANADLTSATDELVELETERLAILADTTSELAEIAEAEDNLLRIENRLRDIEEDRIELQRELAELKAPATADELAEADRNLERATIGLNRAKRKEQELLDSLTKKQKKSLNLSGLSLDQLRTTLANIRAGMDATKRDDSDPNEKTEAEIQEEIASNRLDVLDAEQAVKDATQDILDLKNRVLDNAVEIREKEQQIADLEIDKRQALRDQVKARNDLAKLRAGETAHATELQNIDEKIADAKERQEKATKNIKTATDALKIATIELAIEEAKITGNIAEQFRLESLLLNTKAGIYNISRNMTQELRTQLIDIQNNNVAYAEQERLAQSILDKNTTINSVFGQRLPISSAYTSGLLGQLFTGATINILPPFDPNKNFGGGGNFAEGGMITRPMFANIGEGFKHEMILPLTKPDRVWEIMSRNLPKYPGALRAAQAALGGPGTSPNLSQAVSSLRGAGGSAGNGSHFERDLLNELRMMNEHLDKLNKQDPNVSISVAQKSNDELLRKQILRDVAKMLAERRR
jgi:tape measure domain-containing protein